MNIHEFQAKALLADFGVTVPRGGVAFSADEARQVAADLGGPIWVVKSQIHAGGRGARGSVGLLRQRAFETSPQCSCTRALQGSHGPAAEQL